MQSTISCDPYLGDSDEEGDPDYLDSGLCRRSLCQQQAQLVSRNQPYRLQPSDILELEYVFTPEYNQTATVEPDGTVRLKLVGSVKVAGRV